MFAKCLLDCLAGLLQAACESVVDPRPKVVLRYDLITGGRRPDLNHN